MLPRGEWNGATGGELEALAEACFRFSPQVAIRPGEAVFIDITKSQHLFTEEALMVRLLSLAGRFVETGEWSRVAIAGSAPEALALARHKSRTVGRKGDVRRLPVAVLRDYAAPFGIRLETRASDEERMRSASRIIQVMGELGVTSLGGFEDLPENTLASRFGREGVELQALVRGKIPAAWPGFHPQPRVSESIAVDEGFGESIEALGFLLKTVLDRGMARLRGRAERASTVSVLLSLEKWSTSEHRREFQVNFPMPQGSAQGALPLLIEKLRFELEREPLSAPVQTVTLEVQDTVPGRSAQRNFFNAQEEKDEALEGLYVRLTQKLGEEGIFVANLVDTHRPEEAWARGRLEKRRSENRRVLRTTRRKKAEKSSSCLGSAIEPARRPLRVLRRPERLEVRGPLMRRAAGAVTWRVMAWDGPERLSGEWWKGRGGFDRDYYRVVTEDGRQLWVFEERGNQRYWLQGYFD